MQCKKTLIWKTLLFAFWCAGDFTVKTVPERHVRGFNCGCFLQPRPRKQWVGYLPSVNPLTGAPQAARLMCPIDHQLEHPRTIFPAPLSRLRTDGAREPSAPPSVDPALHVCAPHASGGESRALGVPFLGLHAKPHHHSGGTHRRTPNVDVSITLRNRSVQAPPAHRSSQRRAAHERAGPLPT